MDAERGGVLPAMLPPYAASQSVASEANAVQFIPAGTVHSWRSWLKALASCKARCFYMRVSPFLDILMVDDRANVG